MLYFCPLFFYMWPSQKGYFHLPPLQHEKALIDWAQRQQWYWSWCQTCWRNTVYWVVISPELMLSKVLWRRSSAGMNFHYCPLPWDTAQHGSSCGRHVPEHSTHTAPLGHEGRWWTPSLLGRHILTPCWATLNSTGTAHMFGEQMRGERRLGKGSRNRVRSFRRHMGIKIKLKHPLFFQSHCYWKD